MVTCAIRVCGLASGEDARREASSLCRDGGQRKRRLSRVEDDVVRAVEGVEGEGVGGRVKSVWE